MRESYSIILQKFQGYSIDVMVIFVIILLFFKGPRYRIIHFQYQKLYFSILQYRVLAANFSY